MHISYAHLTTATYLDNFESSECDPKINSYFIGCWQLICLTVTNHNLAHRQPLCITLQKPESPDAIVVEVKLPEEILCVILSQLPLRDVLRCMQVCKAWKVGIEKVVCCEA